VVNVGSGVVLARALGPTGRGDLAIAMLWPPLIAGLGMLSVSDAVTYFVGRDGERASDILSSSLLLGIVQGLVLLGAGWLVLPHLLAGKPSSVISASLFFLLVVPLNPFIGYPLAVLQGRLFMQPFNLARASIHVFYTAALVALWGAGAVTVQTALAASLLATVLTCLLTFRLVATRVEVQLHFTLGIIRSLLKYGIRLHIGSVAVFVSQRVDLLALTFLASSAALGNYVVASAIGAVAGLVPSAVSMVLFPVFSNRDRDTLSRALARFTLVGGGTTVLAAPIFAFVFPWMLPYLFGSAFAPAKPTSVILILASLVRGWNLMLSSILRGSGSPMLASAGEVGGLVILAILLINWAPQYGAYGAALAVLVGALTTCAWAMFQSFRVSRLSMRRMLSYWSADLERFRMLVSEPHVGGS
jgi:O-antigen/teichoic acid export membrane protein